MSDAPATDVSAQNIRVGDHLVHRRAGQVWGQSRPRAGKKRLSGLKASDFSLSSFFAHAVCVTCLLLQRFGFSFSHGQQLFSSVIIFPLLILMLLATGKARINPITGALYICVAMSFLLSTLMAGIDPDLKMRFSILSAEEILFIYAMLTVEPSERFDSAVTLKIFVFYARAIAVLAIIQYGLQFAGLRLFSFTQIAPVLKPILTEVGYHVVAPISYGSPIIRSNGFFLLEPSILSQVMAIGMIVDYFVLSRMKFLPVFAVAILVSFSGTGVLALGLAVVLGSLLMPNRVMQATLFIALAAVVALVCAIAFPAEFATLAARASGADPSGRLRYAVQFDVLKTVLDNSRLAIGFGPGASDGYVLSVSMSAALKLLLDYGILGTLMFSLFLLRAIWRMENLMVSLVCLIIFQTGGGYLVFSPFIFLMALLCIWSRPASKSLTFVRHIQRPWGHRAAVLR